MAWVGDSKFTICSTNNIIKNNCANIQAHHANVRNERFRIFGNNGEIRETFDGIHRVFLRGRIYPGLKTTRSIGDLLAHQIGVTSEPEIKQIPLQLGDKYMIVGVDCLWEYFSCQEIINFILKLPVSDRELHGSTSEKIFQRIRDTAGSMKHNDLTFIISFF